MQLSVQLYSFTEFWGDASASDTIHLTADAQVVGDLTAPRIIIDDGARIRGMVDMGEADNAAPRSRTSSPRPSRAKTAPAPAPAPVDTTDDDDEEPELPSGASTKKVAVKKRRYDYRNPVEGLYTLLKTLSYEERDIVPVRGPQSTIRRLQTDRAPSRGAGAWPSSLPGHRSTGSPDRTHGSCGGE